jgi:hypothetical protein
MVDQRHLTEVIAGTELASGLPMNVDCRLPLDYDPESDAGFILLGQHRAGGKCPLVRIIREPIQFLLRKHRE